LKKNVWMILRFITRVFERTFMLGKIWVKYSGNNHFFFWSLTLLRPKFKILKWTHIFDSRVWVYWGHKAFWYSCQLSLPRSNIWCFRCLNIRLAMLSCHFKGLLDYLGSTELSNKLMLKCKSYTFKSTWKRQTLINQNNKAKVSN